MRAYRVGLLATAVAAALASAPAAAQVPMAPRALGMAGAFVGVARGQEALFENPANLGLSNTPYWSFAFPQVVVGETTVGLGFRDLWDMRRYDKLSASRKTELLSKVPSAGTAVDIDGRLPIVALSFGHTAVGAAYVVRTDHGVAKDIVDLFLNGYNQQRALAGNYTFPNTTGHRASYIDLAAAHGRRFGLVSVGVTGHYYIGRSVITSQLDPAARYCTARAPAPCVTPVAVPQDVNVDYYSLRSEGGHGYGVDVGAAAEPIPGLTVSAAVQNLASSMTWKKDLRYRLITLSRSDFEDADYNQVSTRYDMSERGFDASAPAKVQALRANLFDNTDFTPLVRLGGAFAARTGTTIGAEYQNRTGDTRLQGMWKQSFALGVQQKLPIITLRAGVAKDDADGSLLSAGASLGPVQLGIGKLKNGTQNGADRSGWVVTFGLNARSNALPH
jgi:hypothetical protein